MIEIVLTVGTCVMDFLWTLGLLFSIFGVGVMRGQGKPMPKVVNSYSVNMLFMVALLNLAVWTR